MADDYTTGVSVDDMLMAQAWRDRNKNEENAGGEEAANEPATLREATMAAKAEKTKKEKESGNKKNIENLVSAPLRMATGRALQWAWTVLIPSFGLSLIYINLHVFLRWIFPDAFCKLGQEWTVKIQAAHSKDNIAGTSFGIVEIIGLIFLDLIAFFIIFGFVSIVVWIADNIIFDVVTKVWIWAEDALSWL